MSWTPTLVHQHSIMQISFFLLKETFILIHQYIQSHLFCYRIFIYYPINLPFWCALFITECAGVIIKVALPGQRYIFKYHQCCMAWLAHYVSAILPLKLFRTLGVCGGRSSGYDDFYFRKRPYCSDDKLSIKFFPFSDKRSLLFEYEREIIKLLHRYSGSCDLYTLDTLVIRAFSTWRPGTMYIDFLKLLLSWVLNIILQWLRL